MTNLPKEAHSRQPLTRANSIQKRPRSLTIKRPHSFGKTSFSLGNYIKFGARSRISEFTSIELAKQICLLEFDMFKLIQPREFYFIAAKSKDEKMLTNIRKLISFSNHISFWVITEILSIKKGSKSRARVIEFFIEMAVHFRRLHNFNAVWEIVLGLQHSSIYRLKKTFSKIRKCDLKVLDQLKELTSSSQNFKVFRENLRQANPPLIPIQAVYQSDLTFLHNTGKTFLSPQIVNFYKLYRIADYVFDIKVRNKLFKVIFSPINLLHIILMSRKR
jgi:hypothetical protein